MSIGAIFVDGANMSRALTARAHEGKGNFKLEYGLLAAAMEKEFGMPFPYRVYYTTHRDEESKKRREKFYEHLTRNGWSVFDMPARFVVNTDHVNGIWVDKGVDMAIGLDAFKLAVSGQISVLALATHDSDFAELFKRLPPTVRGVSIGWKERISTLVMASSKPMYLDDMKVLR